MCRPFCVLVQCTFGAVRQMATDLVMSMQIIVLMNETHQRSSGFWRFAKYALFGISQHYDIFDYVHASVVFFRMERQIKFAAHDAFRSNAFWQCANERPI